MNDSASRENGAENGATAGKLVPAARAVPAVRDPYGQVGPYMGGPSDASPDLRLNLVEYWRILNKRKWVIVSVMGVFVVLGALQALMETPLYTATVRLQIDRNVAKVVEGGNVTPIETQDYEFLRTQYELLQGRAIAQRVVSALKLGEDKDFLERSHFSLLGAVKGVVKLVTSPSYHSHADTKTDRERGAVGRVIANRKMRPVSGSRLVDLSYSDPVPARAQKVAAAFASAFIASNLDKRFEANAYAKTFLEDQLKELKLKLEASGKRLLKFAEDEQIIIDSDKSSIAERNLAAANTELGKLVAERIKNEQLWKQVEAADAINLPQLLSNRVIEGLREKRNQLVTEYQEKLETFKPGYPAMLEIKKKIAEYERQLGSEVTTIKESFKAAYENSVAQEKQTLEQIGSLRAEVLELQKKSIEYNILKREVDTNRSLYEGLLQRYKEVDVASGVGANNVFVVDRAELPRLPSSPRVSRDVLLALFFGLGAGLAAAYILERFDDKIRFVEEVERITGLATLGVIPRVSGSGHLDEEMADPRSHLSESYRSLCTALQFSTESGLPRTVFVTSAGAAEGKSLTSLAIARHFANIGLKVLLIDADLRNPSLHAKLGLDNRMGLSNYLTGACSPPETFKKTPVPNLAFMSSGPLPPNAADLLASSRLFSLLSVGLEVFDLIIVDGPPVMGLADAPLLSSAASATIFVVGAGQARTGVVRGALKRLQYARGVVIGTVLTKHDARGAGYGYGTVRLWPWIWLRVRPSQPVHPG